MKYIFFEWIFQGVFPHETKSSSVKKVPLLAVVPDIPKSHFNVKSILEQVDLGGLNFVYAVDVKMGNAYSLTYQI